MNTLPPVNAICPICQRKFGKRDLRQRISLEWDAPYAHSFCARFGRAVLAPIMSAEESSHESAMLEHTGYGARFEA